MRTFWIFHLTAILNGGRRGRSFENYKLFLNSYMLTEFPPFASQIPAPCTLASSLFQSSSLTESLQQATVEKADKKINLPHRAIACDSGRFH